MDAIIGHRHLLDFFEKTIARGALGHTYCFSGVDSVGKRTVARYLAAKILGVEVSKLEQNPDYYYVERANDEKTGKLKKDFSVDQVRALKSHLAHTSWSGGHQVAILDNAELLNESSSNALLKILEEPPEKSVLFLLTNNDRTLLPTIRSRTQIFHLALPPEKDLFAALVARGVLSADVSEIVSGAHGRPGRAIALTVDQVELEKYRAEVARCQSLTGAPFYAKLKSIETIFGDKEDAERGRDNLQKTLDVWISVWRSAMLENVLSGVSSKNIISAIDDCMSAKNLLKLNIHPRLLVETSIIPL